MRFKIDVFEMTERHMDEEAVGFLENAMRDMFFHDTSNAYGIDMLLGWNDSYLLSCTEESGTVCGVFAVHINYAVHAPDCYVNIAYTREDFRRRGIFGTLLAYTKNVLPDIAGIDYDTISFGVYDHNSTMAEVMRKSGCFPVEHVADLGATIYAFPRNVSAIPRLRELASTFTNGVDASRLSA